MKSIKYIVIAVIFFAAGFFLGQSYQPNQPENLSNDNQNAGQNQPEQKLTGTLIIKYDANNLVEIQDIQIMQGESVLALTERASGANNWQFETKDYGSLGLLVTKIGEKENSQDNKYWHYYVNGQLADIGAGNYKLNGGEKIEWVFEESEF